MKVDAVIAVLTDEVCHAMIMTIFDKLEEKYFTCRQDTRTSSSPTFLWTREGSVLDIDDASRVLFSLNLLR